MSTVEHPRINEGILQYLLLFGNQELVHDLGHERTNLPAKPNPLDKIVSFVKNQTLRTQIS